MDGQPDAGRCQFTQRGFKDQSYFSRAFTEIKENEIGLIESVDGSPIPSGRIFAAVVEGHNSFQDGEAFIKNGGQKGPQIEVLPPGNHRINPCLFKVTIGAATKINEGEIGVVESADGSTIPTGRIPATVVPVHNSFQSGQAFMAYVIDTTNITIG